MPDPIFSVELDPDSKSYGRVHRTDCRDCKDGYPLGSTLDEVVANWPWPEEADDITFTHTFMPCALGPSGLLPFPR